MGRSLGGLIGVLSGGYHVWLRIFPLRPRVGFLFKSMWTVTPFVLDGSPLRWLACLYYPTLFAHSDPELTRRSCLQWMRESVSDCSS